MIPVNRCLDGTGHKSVRGDSLLFEFEGYANEAETATPCHGLSQEGRGMAKQESLTKAGHGCENARVVTTGIFPAGGHNRTKYLNLL